MTTCVGLGYKVGDVFEVLRDTAGFKKGSIVTLYATTLDDAPLFKGPNSCFKHASGEEGAYLSLSNVHVRKIGSVEQNSADKNGEDIMAEQQKKKKTTPKGVKQGSITFVYTGTQYKVSGAFEIAVYTAMNADGLVSTSIGYELDTEKGDSHYVGHVEMTVPEDLQYILVKQPDKKDKVVEFDRGRVVSVKEYQPKLTSSFGFTLEL